MDGGGEESGLVRLFVALELAQGLIAQIRAWGERALGDPALRATPAESLHLTLVFLGVRERAAIQPVAEILGECRRPAVALELLEPVPRPARGAARLFALPVRCAAAVALQAEVERRLVAADLCRPASRPFWPHITVARVRSQPGGRGRARAVANPPLPLPSNMHEHLFDAVRLTLYRSDLRPQGARYTPLTQIELPHGRH